MPASLAAQQRPLTYKDDINWTMDNEKMNIRDYLEENVFIALLIVVVVTGGVVFSTTEYFHKVRIASATYDCKEEIKEYKKQL